MPADRHTSETTETTARTAAEDSDTILPDGVVRPMCPEEVRMIGGLMKYLEFGSLADHVADVHVLVWQRARQGIGGFIACSARAHRRHEAVSDEPTVRRIEGLWVASYLDYHRIARTLRAAADAWVRSEASLATIE
jgi:hypothetical protein